VEPASRALTARRSLLARSRTITLAGSEIETPLLIPGISSKAVAPIPRRELGGRREVVAASVVHTDMLIRGIDEALLVSAYDIHHGLVTNHQRFRRHFKSSPYAQLKVLVIDSGWYEKNVGPSSGQWYHEVGPDPQAFEEADYIRLVDSLDLDISAVLVSWDKHGKYLDQITAAQEFFGARPRFTSCILLKPQGSRLEHDFKELSDAEAARLKAFGVIGVTEKELGDSILRRLTTLAQLRLRLDEVGVESPIHVFGGLDPLLTPLYFAAGAELFDGLAWLRYAFMDGMSISRDTMPIFQRNYEKRLPVAIQHIQIQNLDVLTQLSSDLKVFSKSNGNWTKMPRGQFLRPVWEAVESRLGGANGRRRRRR
jgi:hypothetical protein